MYIGIDGNEANVQNRVGSNVFAFEILNHLYKLEETKEKKNQFIIYLQKNPLEDLPKQTFWWQYKVVKPEKLWTRIALPLKLYFQKQKLDIFFSPGHYSPRFCPCPLAITILDTSYLLYPQYFLRQDLFKLKNWTASSAKSAKIIFTISENSKKDIMKYYQRKSEDIFVIYPGYDDQKYNLNVKNQMSKIKDIKNTLKINGEYLIYVGTLQPRKNLIRLIEAFKMLKIKNPSLRNLKLVIVGKKGWLFEEIFAKTQELGIEKDIIFTGYVQEGELPYLIAGAKLYVLPSLYEGFGIPVVTAMAVGTPVVVSGVSSLPEIAGDCAVYIKDPTNTGNIIQALKKALSLKEGQRDEIIKKGSLQAQKFRFKKSAEIIYKEFKKYER